MIVLRYESTLCDDKKCSFYFQAEQHFLKHNDAGSWIQDSALMLSMCKEVPWYLVRIGFSPLKLPHFYKSKPVHILVANSWNKT